MRNEFNAFIERDGDWFIGSCQEIQIDQGVLGLDVLLRSEEQKRAEPVVALAGESVPVCDQGRQEIKQVIMMSEIPPEAIAWKAMLDCGETSRHLPDPLGAEQLF